jgi:hypothetical protein
MGMSLDLFTDQISIPAASTVTLVGGTGKPYSLCSRLRLDIADRLAAYPAMEFDREIIAKMNIGAAISRWGLP